MPQSDWAGTKQLVKALRSLHRITVAESKPQGMIPGPHKSLPPIPPPLPPPHSPALPACTLAAGRTVAVKSIPKVLIDPNASERKKKEQIPYLKREVCCWTAQA
jgi:hypothetical protein